MGASPIILHFPAFSSRLRTDIHFYTTSKPVNIPCPKFYINNNQNGRVSVAEKSDFLFEDEEDIHALLKILPRDLHEVLLKESKKAQLLEVVLDVGRLPEARYMGEFGGKYLRSTKVVSVEELEDAQNAVGEFGKDNRAGIEGTLHRISAIRSRKGAVLGLTCRVGRAVSGQIDMVRDLLEYSESILFVGSLVDELISTIST